MKVMSIEIKLKQNFFFNYDETHYNVINLPKTAIRTKGSDTTKIKCKENFKESFTLGLTISLSRRFLRPMIVAKGKTKRCLEKFKLDVKNTIGAYTDSSWVNDDCILIVLDEIYKITKGENSVLLLDKHDSHKTEKVKNYANDKNIHLIYIPEGMTSVFQPLDIKINGIIKERAIQKFSNFKAKNPNTKYKHDQCLIDILEIIKSINKKTIYDAFNCLNVNKE